MEELGTIQYNMLKNEYELYNCQYFPIYFFSPYRIWKFYKGHATNREIMI